MPRSPAGSRCSSSSRAFTSNTTRPGRCRPIDINDATDIAQCVAMTALNIAERPEPLKFTSTDKAKGGTRPRPR